MLINSPHYALRDLRGKMLKFTEYKGRNELKSLRVCMGTRHCVCVCFFYLRLPRGKTGGSFDSENPPNGVVRRQPLGELFFKTPTII